MTALPERRLQVAPALQSRCAWSRDYSVHVVDSLFAETELVGSIFQGRRALVVAPKAVWGLYGSRFEELAQRLSIKAEVVTLDTEESTKSMDEVIKVCHACAHHGMGRTDVLVALGGGVCMDVVTVAASLVRRGIGYVCVPTTLVGLVDAGIGIKGAINFEGRKSYLGSFYPPESVLVDASFLATSPQWSLLDGMAEIVKIALIRDPELFETVERHGRAMLRQRFGDQPEQVRDVLVRSIDGMLKELAPNIFEDQTYYRLVDFGHTFSTAIEERSNHKITHGQAVAIDMALSAVIAELLGELQPDLTQRIHAVLRSLGLPRSASLLSVELCEQALASAVAHRGGTPNLVIPHGLGKCGFVDDIKRLGPELLGEALRRVREA